MKKGLITSILALTFTGLQAQPLPATPKLVVTLTIDQLRTDYMEAFSSLYGMINKVRKRQKSRYMVLNFIVLTLFILLWAIIPQRFDLAVLPLALCLLVRSASNLILTSKKR